MEQKIVALRSLLSIPMSLPPIESLDDVDLKYIAEGCNDSLSPFGNEYKDVVEQLQRRQEIADGQINS